MSKKKVLSLFTLVLMSIALVVTGCSKSTSGGSTDSKKLKIGYVVNFGSHEWYQNIIKGAEATAKEKGYEFEWADANLDLNKQITMAENLLTKGVNVLVLSPVDPKGLSNVMDEAKKKGVKVITESNPIPGALTTIGIKNLDAGEMIGKWAGEYIKANFKEKANILIVGLPSQQDTRDRVEGFKKGIQSTGANYTVAQEVDGKGVKDQALKISTDAITANKNINVIYGINDDSALGAQQAYEEAKLDKNKLLTIGFGVEGIAGKDALTSGGAYKAGLAMFPEYVGRTMIEQAEKAFKNQELPERTITPMTVLTPDNLSKYYTKKDKAYTINFDNVVGLLQK
jgi:ribose transport system substrate-binding protein